MYYQPPPSFQMSPIRNVQQIHPIQRPQLIPVVSATSQMRLSKGSQLKTHLPYQADPEVERIIRKYTQSSSTLTGVSGTSGVTVHQPITHSQHHSSKRQQLTNKQQDQDYDVNEFKDFQSDQKMNQQVPFQFDEVHKRNSNTSGVSYFNEQTQPQIKPVNDKTIQYAIMGILGLLAIYIIVILLK